MKELIKEMKKDIPKVKEHIFGAIKRSNIKGWESLNVNIKEEKES